MYVRYCDGASYAGNLEAPVKVQVSHTISRPSNKACHADDAVVVMNWPPLVMARTCAVYTRRTLSDCIWKVDMPSGCTVTTPLTHHIQPTTDPQVGSDTIYYRGRRNLDAYIAAWLARGIGKAKAVLVNGCSAGGLAVYLHLDYIRSRIPSAVDVRGIPECGMFLDLKTWDRKPAYTPNYQWVAGAQNVTGGVNAACIAATPALEQWKCFMAQYTLPHIKVISHPCPAHGVACCA